MLKNSNRIEIKKKKVLSILLKRVHILLSEKELRKLSDDSSNILKRSNIEHYIGRPSAII